MLFANMVKWVWRNNRWNNICDNFYKSKSKYMYEVIMFENR